MKNILSSTYFPFGALYYKAPSPPESEWENDLRNMSELGFNTVKICVQWRWNHPAEDHFNFDDIDKLMDLSGKYNLHVMLNPILDTAPGWIYNKYPDASMVTLDGRKIGPQTQPNRPIGGLGYCFNHDEVKKHSIQFLNTTIDHYKDHPALEIWNVGNKHELTSSIAEMRGYANNVDKIGDMLCYCNNCKVKFKKWLEEKYSNIAELNDCWNRNYASYDDVELPLSRNNFNDIIDWRMFFVDTLNKNIALRFRIAKNIDNGKHPLMCHHASIQDFPVTSTASDPWNVGRLGDLHGNTLMDDPAMIDILRSCAKDKPVIAAELVMQKGNTLDIPINLNKNDIKRIIFSAIAGNLKGFVFKQYRPEIMGREAPAWGLTTLDGKPTELLELYAEIGKVFQKHAEFLLDAKPRKAEVAILYNPENQIFSWASTGKESSATDSVLGIHRALYDKNYNIDFLHPMELSQEILAGYKVIIIPFPYLINDKTAQVIKNWVNDGGLLISEAYTAGWNIEHGHHEEVIPGYGFAEVFQATQISVKPVDNEKGVEIITGEKNLFGENIKLKGYFVKEELLPGTAEIIGKYASGETAVTIGEFGKGKAIAIGTFIGIVYKRENHSPNATYLAKLIEKYSDVEIPIVDFGRVVRVDLLRSENNKSMLIVQNKQLEALETAVNLNVEIADELAEQFSEEIVKVERTEEGVKIPFYLEPNQVKVYFG